VKICNIKFVFRNLDTIYSLCYNIIKYLKGVEYMVIKKIKKLGTETPKYSSSTCNCGSCNCNCGGSGCTKCERELNSNYYNQIKGSYKK